ncbi:MAG: hypothetical protein PWK00_00490, partial [Coxiella burnetii]|nr:hypothetical protein [Coxiella burnetii]
ASFAKERKKQSAQSQASTNLPLELLLFFEISTEAKSGLIKEKVFLAPGRQPAGAFSQLPRSAQQGANPLCPG